MSDTPAPSPEQSAKSVETSEHTNGSSDSAPSAASIEEDTPKISFNDFLKVDLRVAQIEDAERIEKSEKLVKLQVSLGNSQRQIIAGIAKHYEPQKLVGRKIIVVANLKPAKLMGEKSEGMLLAASDEHGNLALLDIDPVIPAGASVG